MPKLFELGIISNGILDTIVVSLIFSVVNLFYLYERRFTTRKGLAVIWGHVFLSNGVNLTTRGIKNNQDRRIYFLRGPIQKMMEMTFDLSIISYPHVTYHMKEH